MEYPRECRRKQRGSLRKMQRELMNKILAADVLIYTLCCYILFTNWKPESLWHYTHSPFLPALLFSVQCFQGLQASPRKDKCVWLDICFHTTDSK